MRPRLGQHFLRDPKVVQTILASGELSPEDRVLEIGPGKGVLTEPLSERVQHLVAIELDNNLADKLKTKFSGKNNVTILQADFLKVNLEDVIRQTSGDPSVKVLGNLPYSITSPIFEKLMPWTFWETGVFLIQREVAARITARPGSRDYGILSLAVQLFAEAEIILHVKPGAFIPPPKVSSAVIRLRRKAQPLVSNPEIPDFFDLVHGAFAHRRKTIANSLAYHTHIARSEVEKWLRTHGVDDHVRAENIFPHHYAKLAGAWSIFRRETNLT